jgi:hypothetical protein
VLPGRAADLENQAVNDESYQDDSSVLWLVLSVLYACTVFLTAGMIRWRPILKKLPGKWVKKYYPAVVGPAANTSSPQFHQSGQGTSKKPRTGRRA